MKEKTAELCGAIVGDGWIQSNKKNMFISGHPTEDREYIENTIVQLFENVVKRKIEPRMFTSWGTFGVGIYRINEIGKFIEMGIPIGKKGTLLDIPKTIKNSNIENKKAFLRGLFDTDGTIYFMNQNGKYTRPRIRITSISKKMIDEVKKICNELKIEYSNPSPTKESERRPNKSYIFEINKKSSIDRWFSIIKPHNTKHLTKFEIWKEMGYLEPRTTLEQRNKMLFHNAKLKTMKVGI